MKTLFCLRSSPYPPIGGSPLRNWQNINAMGQYGPVAIFTAFPSDPPIRDNPFGPWEHFPITDMSWAEPDNWRDYLNSLRPWGHEGSDRLYRPAAAAQFRALLQSFQPDWIVFGEPWMYRYFPIARAYSRNLIFDNHNVEARVSLYQDRLPRRGGLKGRIEARLRHQQVLNLERTLCKQSKQVWVCSEFDQAELCQTYGISQEKVKVIANGIDVDRFKPVRENSLPLPAPLKLGDQAILFPATFDYSANIWAAEWLLREIYPQIQQRLPDVKLMLVGRAPTEEMQAAAEANPNIIVPGIVDDIRPYYQAATAVVVPLRHGSGTRLKLLEAFAAQRPVVSTAKGVEGLAVVDQQQCCLAETADGIAAALVELLSQPDQAQALVTQGFELVEQQHSWQATHREIGSALDGVGLDGVGLDGLGVGKT
jgi:polysaccharide biosynthesis protein PslH